VSGYTQDLVAESALEAEVVSRLAEAGVELVEELPAFPSGHFLCQSCFCTWLPDFYNGDVYRYTCYNPPGLDPDHDCKCHAVVLPSASDGRPLPDPRQCPHCDSDETTKFAETSKNEYRCCAACGWEWSLPKRLDSTPG